jgi:hypothetical protein
MLSDSQSATPKTAIVLRWPWHQFHRPRDHVESWQSDSCQACVLAFCKVCKGAEGSLPTHCPGERMGGDVADAVYAELVDFKNGEWVQK